MGSGSQSEVKGLVAVELTDGEALVRRRPVVRSSSSTLTVCFSEWQFHTENLLACTTGSTGCVEEVTGPTSIDGPASLASLLNRLEDGCVHRTNSHRYGGAHRVGAGVYD
jgi:hypothetical protein